MDWKEKINIIEKIARKNFSDAGEAFSVDRWAKRLGTSPATIHRWKAGAMPSSEALAVMARELKLSPAWLLLDEGDPYAPAPAAGPDIEAPAREKALMEKVIELQDALLAAQDRVVRLMAEAAAQGKDVRMEAGRADADGAPPPGGKALSSDAPRERA